MSQMKNKSENTELVLYNDKYAAGISEMWDNSVEGWNGDIFQISPETVIEQQNNSSNLQLMLAKTGDDLIAGYCTLSIDHHDEGALYIDLLNVRDDYHGKKIGKKLVLDALNRTIELKWSRLDLFTWPGNTKAVPLYKKCGFFWEKRDDTTHLINLIPTVLQTELFEDYFSRVDWYKDSTRKIEVKPDSNIQNKFDYWKYSWEKDVEGLLEVEFSRRGRGIRRIETDDYSITATVENLNLVFGLDYKIKYEIVNKTGKNLRVELEGQDDKNIKFDFHSVVSVGDTKKEIEAEFFVGTIEKDQLEDKTHPSVITTVLVNGKKVVFKTGIVPKFPLSTNLVNPQDLSFPNVWNEIFLDVENHFDKKAIFTIELPSTADVEIEPKQIIISLEANEKLSLSLNYKVKKNAYFSEKIEVKVDFENRIEESFSFKSEISKTFITGFGSFSGENKSRIIVGIGNFVAILYKDHQNAICFTGSIDFAYDTYLDTPMLGLPFSGEFEHKQYESFETEKGNGWIMLKVKYNSDTFKDISFVRKLKVYENGILERWFEVTNNGNSSSLKELQISDPTYFRNGYLTLPYDDKFIFIEDDNNDSLEVWDGNKFTENWIMCNTGKSTIGISWKDDQELKFIHGTATLVSKLGKLEAGETKITEPIINTVNTFKDWHLFREFVNGKRLKRELLTPYSEFVINKGNPFISSEFIAELNFYSTKKNKANISFTADNLLGKTENKVLNNTKSISFTGKLENKISISELNLSKLEFEKKFQKVVFKLSENNDMKLSENKDVLEVDNGIINFKSSRTFAPSIFSLEYNGDEWLDTAYPEIISKSWWNPWLGGIVSHPRDIDISSIVEEEYKTEFIKNKIDSKGNKWSGIKITVDIQKKEDKKGLKFSTYYLVLPGAPILLTFCEFTHKDEYSKDRHFTWRGYFKGKENLKRLSVEYDNKIDKPMKFIAGSDSVEYRTKGNLSLHDKDRKEFLISYCNDNDTKGYYVDMVISEMWFISSKSARAGETVKTKPNFFIFSEVELDKEVLVDLDGIRFK